MTMMRPDPAAAYSATASTTAVSPANVAAAASSAEPYSRWAVPPTARVNASRGAASPRSARLHGHSAGMPASSMAPPQPTGIPSAVATTSSISRVLPMPAGPPTRTRWPPPARASAHRRRSSASSARRPTNGSRGVVTCAVSPGYRGGGCSTRLGSSTEVTGRPVRQRDGMDLNTAVHGLFAPASRPGRIGVEVELIPVTDTARPEPVDPAELAGGFDARFVRAAAPTFEPGGQLELSPPPRADVATLISDVVGLVGRARAIAAARDVRLEAVGTNPYHSCAQVPLRTPTPRYRAMQRMFDRTGPDGRRMMRLTASLQICVDLLPGPAGREQWLVANLAGPPLTAAFANSTVVDGRKTAVPGARTRIWRGIDPRRTGYDGRHLDLTDPVGAYLAFAAAAPRLPIPETADP